MRGNNIRRRGDACHDVNRVMRERCIHRKKGRRSGYSYGLCHLALIWKASISGYFRIFQPFSSLIAFFPISYFDILSIPFFSRDCVLCNEVNWAMLSATAADRSRSCFPSQLFEFTVDRLDQMVETLLAPWQAFQIACCIGHVLFFSSHRSKGHVWQRRDVKRGAMH